MQQAVFLDRDGVLNRLVLRDGREASPRTMAEFALLPGVRCAVEALRAAELLVIVVTNQPDVARSAVSAEELEGMHARLLRSVPVDAIYTCPHDDRAACVCRKPKSGLLLRAAEELNINLEESWMVGDSWKDIHAGKGCGCACVLIGAVDLSVKDLPADFTARDLRGAAEVILAKLNRSCTNDSFVVAQEE